MRASSATNPFRAVVEPGGGSGGWWASGSGPEPSGTLTVHLALVGQNNLPSTAWRVDGQGFLEALLDVGTPDALGVGGRELFVVIAVPDVQLQRLVGVGLPRLRSPRGGNRGGCGGRRCQQNTLLLTHNRPAMQFGNRKF